MSVNSQGTSNVGADGKTNYTSDAMYDYLIEEFGNCQIVQGGYKVEENNDIIYISDANSNAGSMISYMPGLGEGGKTFFLNKVETEGIPSGCIVTVSATSEDPNQSMQIGAKIASDNNIQLEGVLLETFSGSGDTGFRSLTTFLENNPTIGPTTMLIGDGYDMEFSDEQIAFLRDNQIPIISVQRENDSYINTCIEDLGKQGLNIYAIHNNYVNIKSHPLINEDILNMDLHKYLLGIDNFNDEKFKMLENGFINSNVLLSAREHGNLSEIIYSYPKRYNINFDPNLPESETNKKWIEVPIEELLKLTMIDNSTYKIQGLNKYSLVEGTVSSDLYQITQQLNNINASISNNASIIATQSPILTSTTEVPSGLINCQSSLLSISSDLINKVDRETQLIANIAQTMFDMDKGLGKYASQLSGGEISSSVIDIELNKILNSSNSTEITFSNFMYEPTAILKSGSTKVSMSDINSMFDGVNLKGPLAENLTNEKTSALNSKDAIDALIGTISGNANFQGSAWKAVESKLGTYSNLMKLRHDSAVKMEEATKKALKLIKDYMGEYEELDYSELDILKEELVRVKQLIENLIYIMTSTKKVTKTTDFLSIPIQVTVYEYSQSARTQAKADLETAEKQVTEISKEIARLEGLPDIIAQAEQIMNDAMSEIYSNYGAKVSDTVTGKSSSYIPPANTNYIKSDKVYEIETYDYVPEKGTFKVSEERFNESKYLQNKWRTYEDYLLGVKAVNNPINQTLESQKTPDTNTQSINQNINNKDEITNVTSNVTADGKSNIQINQSDTSQERITFGSSSNQKPSIQSIPSSADNPTENTDIPPQPSSNEERTSPKMSQQNIQVQSSIADNPNENTDIPPQSSSNEERTSPKMSQQNTQVQSSIVSNKTQKPSNIVENQNIREEQPKNINVENKTIVKESIQNSQNSLNSDNSKIAEKSLNEKIFVSNLQGENIISSDNLNKEIFSKMPEPNVKENNQILNNNDSINLATPLEKDIIQLDSTVENNSVKEKIENISNLQTSTNENQIKNNKTIATLSAIGAAIGSAGYAGYKYIDSKNDKEQKEY